MQMGRPQPTPLEQAGLMRGSVLQTSNEGSAASGAPAGFDVSEAQMVERELERASDSDSLQGDQQHLVRTSARRAQGMSSPIAKRLIMPAGILGLVLSCHITLASILQLLCLLMSC